MILLAFPSLIVIIICLIIDYNEDMVVYYSFRTQCLKLYCYILVCLWVSEENQDCLITYLLRLAILRSCSFFG